MKDEQNEWDHHWAKQPSGKDFIDVPVSFFSLGLNTLKSIFNTFAYHAGYKEPFLHTVEERLIRKFCQRIHERQIERPTGILKQKLKQLERQYFLKSARSNLKKFTRDIRTAVYGARTLGIDYDKLMRLEADAERLQDILRPVSLDNYPELELSSFAPPRGLSENVMYCFPITHGMDNEWRYVFKDALGQIHEGKLSDVSHAKKYIKALNKAEADDPFSENLWKKKESLLYYTCRGMEQDIIEHMMSDEVYAITDSRMVLFNEEIKIYQIRLRLIYLEGILNSLENSIESEIFEDDLPKKILKDTINGIKIKVNRLYEQSSITKDELLQISSQCEMLLSIDSLKDKLPSSIVKKIEDKQSSKLGILIDALCLWIDALRLWLN